MLQIGTDALRRFPEIVNTQDEKFRRLFQSNAEDASGSMPRTPSSSCAHIGIESVKFSTSHSSEHGSLSGMDLPL